MANDTNINEKYSEYELPDLDDLTEEEKLTSEQRLMLGTIELYTTYYGKITEKIFLLLCRLYKTPATILYDKEKETYQCILNDRKIGFDVLSRYYNSKINKKTLTSNERYGKCHSLSILIALNLENSNLITGYLSGFNNQRILHSVVEVVNNFNQTMYIDPTKNLIIPKESYIKLTNFVPMKTISSKEINEDSKVIDIFNISSKAYAINRELIIEDYKKTLRK